MQVKPKILQQIADLILQKLRSASFVESKKLLQMSDYHGFLKSSIPKDFLEEILTLYQLSQDEVQIEIVEVKTDLSKEIHYHKESYAYCVCLGEEHQVKNPHNAKAFLNDKWFSVKAGNIIKIPPNTPHGFTVENGGILTFLSVQAPPVERGDVDDYYKIKD